MLRVCQYSVVSFNSTLRLAQSSVIDYFCVLLLRTINLFCSILFVIFTDACRGVCAVMLKLHLFDLLWICCTTCCTTNPQQVEMSTTNPQQIESCTTNLQHLDMSRCCGFVVDLS